MVRRDATESLIPLGVRPEVARCAFPAGASPVPVGAEAPGSRPPVEVERPKAEAWRRKPLRREQQRGPQHEVKLAASTHSQSGSRAAHVTAKATSVALVSERAIDPGGVWSAARVEGEARNTRGPSWSPSSRHGGSYKPMAKSSAAKRESEGLVVPSIAATNNAAGGKGPCFGRARSEGKREGMAAMSGPKTPNARMCDAKVQQPQHELWAGAERQGAPRRHMEKRARSDARAYMWRWSGSLAVQAPSRRPSVSRVREIRMHGLKGGLALSSMNNRSEM